MTEPFEHKVFNLGLPRSGTSSFARACQLLGFRSLHSNNGEIQVLGPAIGDFGKGLPSAFDAYIRDFDAFSDLPWYAIPELLLARFPDARFCMTTRSAEDWSLSIPKILPAIRSTIERQFHQTYFGPALFANDREKLVEYYDNHVAAARRLFGDRLVEIDLREPDVSRWSKLAGLLDYPLHAPLDWPWPKISDGNW